MLKEQISFKYKADTSNPAVIGVLEGPCADIVNPTRNDRTYPDAVWEKAFSDPIVVEKMQNGGIFGEIEHPKDRDEVDPEKIAIGMKDFPYKHDNKLYGRFYILNTPCGRILKTLADFGYKIGISSRGNGETYMTESGEVVDPDTYDFICFDAVLMPSVKSARMNYITESLEGKTLKKALNEALDNSNEKEKEIMKKCLDELDIDYKQATNDSATEQVDNIDQDISNNSVDNNKEGLTDTLTETLIKNRELEKTIESLQEKLSVCYTKERESSDIINKYKQSIITLTESIQKLKSLKTKKDNLERDIDSKSEEIKKKDSIIEKLRESLQTKSDQINKKSEDISELQISLKDKEEEIKSKEDSYNKLQESLQVKINDLKDQINQNNINYSKKIKEKTKLCEQYKLVAKKSVDKYISLQAKVCGIDETDIKNRLRENYTFNDIDKLCEDLKAYNLNVSKLPFDLEKLKNSKVKIHESKESIMKTISSPDDDIDNQLMMLAKIN